METIGDAYMVAAGAPERRGKHAEMMCNMGLDMVEAITDLKDPSTGTPGVECLHRSHYIMHYYSIIHVIILI